MASWRETASQQAQDDLDHLMGTALGFAQQSLEQHGEFYPYGLAVDLSGELTMISADTLKEHPESSEVITAVLAQVQERESDLRAIAITADVSDPQLGGDAIRVSLEHREGANMMVFLPYKQRRQQYEFMDLVGAVGSPYIWGN